MRLGRCSDLTGELKRQFDVSLDVLLEHSAANFHDNKWFDARWHEFSKEVAIEEMTSRMMQKERELGSEMHLCQQRCREVIAHEERIQCNIVLKAGAAEQREAAHAAARMLRTDHC